MSLSGGFLFRAAETAGVQNVTFAGVFVPQVWNQPLRQSASRNHPVGTQLRLCHAVHGSYITCCRNVVFLYTSRTSLKSLKFPCRGKQGLGGPPCCTLHSGQPTARLDYGGNDPLSGLGVPIGWLATHPFNAATHRRTGKVGPMRTLTKAHAGY